jgi:hypothetical protein
MDFILKAAVSIVLVLFGCSVYGQNNNGVGTTKDRTYYRGTLASDTVLTAPADTLKTKLGRNTGNLAVKGGLFWYFNGSKYVTPTGGGGGSGTVTNVSTGYGMLGGPITTAGTVRVDTFEVANRRYVDSVAANIPSSFDTTHIYAALADSMQTVRAEFVPYTGATQDVDLGTKGLTAQWLMSDTVQSNTGTLHLHGSGGTGILIGSSGSLLFDHYPTAVAGDSVLSTNSAGALQQYDLKTKLATYLLRSDTATFVATRSWVGLQIPSLTGYVPYTGATTNLDLGTHSITAADGIINHPSGSGTALSVTKGGTGTALSVTKGGNGIGLFVDKTSGTGNAMEVLGGVTLLYELHLTNTLKAAYIDTLQMSTRAWRQKGIDSLNIVKGTVFSVAAANGYGLTISGSPVTGTGTITATVDSSLIATRLIVKKQIDSVAALGGGITALTGDVTASGSGTVTATLATVNANPARVGSATVIPRLTIDAKGRVTLVDSVTASGGGGVAKIKGVLPVTISAGTGDTVIISISPNTTYTITEATQFGYNGANGLIQKITMNNAQDTVTVDTTTLVEGVTYELRVIQGAGGNKILHWANTGTLFQGGTTATGRPYQDIGSGEISRYFIQKTDALLFVNPVINNRE